MKRGISLFLMIVVLFGLLCGCNGSKPEGKHRIVVTNFAVYDWAKQILGENPAGIEVVLLLDSGVDLHSFQPTADDILQIQTASLFVYVSDQSEIWVQGVLRATNSQGICLAEILKDDLKCLEDHGTQEDHEDHEHAYDEHVWTSLKNAQKVCRSLFAYISGIDGENRQVYEANLESYCQKLEALDGQYTDAVQAGSKDTVVFGDRFPFLYLFSDYGLGYEAAFSGCSSESGATFETISRLAGKVDELGLKTVMVIEGGKTDVAQAVIAATRDKDQKIGTMNSMQTITAKDLQNGVSYLQIMEENLRVLIQALK